MSLEEKELLTRTFEYVRENNKILRKMRRSMRFSRVLRFVYWIIIFIAAIWLYKFLEPTISSFLEILNSLGGFENFQNLIKSDAV